MSFRQGLVYSKRLMSDSYYYCYYYCFEIVVFQFRESLSEIGEVLLNKICSFFCLQEIWKIFVVYWESFFYYNTCIFVWESGKEIF